MWHPDQVVILPISEKFNDYAFKIAKEMNALDIRVTVDDSNEKIGRKIRDNEMKKIPYMLVVGEKEAENGEVPVRRQGEGDKGAMLVADFAELELKIHQLEWEHDTAKQESDEYRLRIALRRRN